MLALVFFFVYYFSMELLNALPLAKIITPTMILLTGLTLSALVKRKLSRATAKSISNVDDKIAPVVSRTLNIIVYGIAFLNVLNAMGVSLTPFYAITGAIAFALSGVIKQSLGATAENVWSFVLIVFNKPYEIGEKLKINGERCVIDKLRLLETEVTYPGKGKTSYSNTEIINARIIRD